MRALLRLVGPIHQRQMAKKSTLHLYTFIQFFLAAFLHRNCCSQADLGGLCVDRTASFRWTWTLRWTSQFVSSQVWQRWIPCKPRPSLNLQETVTVDRSWTVWRNGSDSGRHESLWCCVGALHSIRAFHLFQMCVSKKGISSRKLYELGSRGGSRDLNLLTSFYRSLVPTKNPSCTLCVHR